ncbi:MAG: hypothetical protein ACK5RL_12860, partial [Acidimicrobiales bacterium]
SPERRRPQPAPAWPTAPPPDPHPSMVGDLPYADDDPPDGDETEDSLLNWLDPAAHRTEHDR